MLWKKKKNQNEPESIEHNELPKGGFRSFEIKQKEDSKVSIRAGKEDEITFQRLNGDKSIADKDLIKGIEIEEVGMNEDELTKINVINVINGIDSFTNNLSVIDIEKENFKRQSFGSPVTMSKAENADLGSFVIDSNNLGMGNSVNHSLPNNRQYV